MQTREEVFVSDECKVDRIHFHNSDTLTEKNFHISNDNRKVRGTPHLQESQFWLHHLALRRLRHEASNPSFPHLSKSKMTEKKQKHLCSRWHLSSFSPFGKHTGKTPPARCCFYYLKKKMVSFNE